MVKFSIIFITGSSRYKFFTLVSQSFVELKISPLPESYILLAEMPLELL